MREVKRPDFNLAELLNTDELQSIQDNLAELSGSSIVIFDPTGKPVTRQSPPYVRFCEEVIRNSPEGKRMCQECDKKGERMALRSVLKGELPESYQCHAGIWDYAAPILINKMHFGYLWCGRVRSEKVDPLHIDKYRENAEKCGLDPEKYIAALKEVPVITKEKIDATTKVVYQVAMAIASQAYEKIIQEQKADSALDELWKREQELSILHKTSSLIMEQGDPKVVLSKVLEEAKASIDADSLCLYRYEEENDRFDIPIFTGVNYENEMMGPIGKKSIVWKLFDENTPRFAEDSQEDVIFNGPFVKREGIVSSAAFPLRIQDHFVGILFVNFQEKQGFLESRRQSLIALANQVALAVAYYWAAYRIRAKADQLSQLSNLGTLVLGEEELDKVFAEIVKSVHKAFGFDGVALYVVEEEKNCIRGRYAEGLAREWCDSTPRLLDEKNILPYIWRNKKTRIIKGYNPRFDKVAYKTYNHKEWIRIFMPIKDPNNVVGVLEAGYLRKNKGQIDYGEIEVLESFVNQAAIAIRNARWLQQNRTSMKVAEVLSREKNIKKILESTISSIREVIPCNNCSVFLIDKKQGILRARASEGDESKQVLKVKIQPNQGITGHVYSSGKHLIVKNSNRMALHIPGTNKRSDWLMSVPIKSGKRVLGTINLNRYGLVTFTDEDLAWITTLADQVYVAIERNELLQRLNSSAKAILQTLKLEDVLEKIAAQAAETLDVYFVSVMLLEGEQEFCKYEGTH